MWSDKETAIDSLNIQHLVTTVLSLLDLPQLSPVTVGIFGDWGSGKSSVVCMIEKALEKPERKKDILCVHFNGWRFEGYEDAKTALMAAILEEIRDRRTLVPKAKEVLTALFHRINWFRLGMSFGQLALHLGLAALTGGATAPASAAALAIEKAQHVKVDDLEGLVNKTEERAENVHMTVREFEADFEILLEQTGLRRLVVVIDDLDRCLPDRVIATLEAIRLFLSVPKTVFIIAADDALIRYAVKQRFSEIEGLKVSVDRDYLEKMVQIPVRVPPLGRGDLETYLNMLFVQLHLSEKEFEQVCERLLKASQGQVGKAILTAASAEKYIEHPLSEALREDLALSARLSQVIALSIDGNPRQLKRYLNAYRLRLMMSEARGVSLPPRIAAKLMLLEYFRPEPFRVLARWQSLHNGKVPELAALEAVRSAASMPPGEDGRTPKTGHSGPIARGSEGASATPARRKSTPASRKVLEAVDAPEGPSGPLPAEDEAADELPTESQSWICDEWLRAWLDTEPQLGNEDLGAYFYFARDRLTQRGIVTQRLSPLAQRLFGELLSESKAVRDAAATQAKDMMSPDAVALQEALAENVRISDDLEDARSPLLGLFALVSARQDLAMDLISLLRSLPVSSFRAGTPGRLLAAIGSSPARAAARQLLEKWATQTENPTLQAAARQALQRQR